MRSEAPPGKRIPPPDQARGSQNITATTKRRTESLTRRSDEQQQALAALRRGEAQRGRQGKLPRVVSYRRSR